MQKDNIKNAKKYYELSEYIKLGLEYLENTDFSEMQNGKYKILGDFVFAIVQDYHSKPESEGKFEVHKKFIDIQYIIDGEERMGVGDINNFSETTKYDDVKDIVFLEPKAQSMPDFLNLKEKEFVIFMPSDAHMPSISVKDSSYVKKVVVKVSV